MKTFKTVNVSEVKIGKRFRQDLGELNPLADSIKNLGLLEPIGLTKDMQLIYGERRLRAVRDVLNNKTIDACIIDLDEFGSLAAEFAENEIRKDFTPSERVALAKAIAEAGAVKPTNGETVKDAAARAAGFSSTRTMERVEKTITQGAPETVEALDQGAISPHQASEISKLPVEDQPDAVKRAVETKEKKDKPGTDQPVPVFDKVGNKLPVRLRDIFLDSHIQRLGLKLAGMADTVEALGVLQAVQTRAKRYPFIELARIEKELKAAKTSLVILSSYIKQNLPYAMCMECRGKGCPSCKQAGYLTQALYEELNADASKPAPAQGKGKEAKKADPKADPKKTK